MWCAVCGSVYVIVVRSVGNMYGFCYPEYLSAVVLIPLVIPNLFRDLKGRGERGIKRKGRGEGNKENGKRGEKGKIGRKEGERKEKGQEER